MKEDCGYLCISVRDMKSWGWGDRNLESCQKFIFFPPCKLAPPPLSFAICKAEGSQIRSQVCNRKNQVRLIKILILIF